MTNNHPDDIHIQKYVLQELNGEAEIIEHILHCNTCKIKAEQYSVLLKEINQQEKPLFDFDLSQLVLEQIIKPKSRYSPSMLMVCLLVFVCFIPFFMVFYQLRIAILHIITGSSALIFYIILMTILFILVFQHLEFYKKYKQKMNALNF